tara:strand:- start:126 stop:317 length:192 start_codon:yes stop_codon:yes gene_type:complete
MKVGDLVKTTEESVGFPTGSLGILVSNIPQKKGWDAWYVLMAGTSKPAIWVTKRKGHAVVEAA